MPIYFLILTQRQPSTDLHNPIYLIAKLIFRHKKCIIKKLFLASKSFFKSNTVNELKIQPSKKF